MKRRNWIALGVVGLLTAVLLVVNPTRPAPAQAQANLDGEVHRACYDAIRGELMSPSSMKRAGQSEIVWTGSTAYYRMLVDSDNAFGASLRSEWACSYADGRAEVVQLD